jgi:hypothetical protein
MPRPRGGDWLEDEAQSWRRSGVDIVVSLLTPEEVADLDLLREDEICRDNRIQLISFQIADRRVPSSQEATSELVTKLADLLADGKNVAIHCRQGIGRAPLIAIALLTSAGFDAEAAIQRVSAARGCEFQKLSNSGGGSLRWRSHSRRRPRVQAQYPRLNGRGSPRPANPGH